MREDLRQALAVGAFHIKHGVIADLAAVATVITDPAERRRVLMYFVDDFNHRNGPDSRWPTAVLAEWVEHSPLGAGGLRATTRSRRGLGRPAPSWA